MGGSTSFPRVLLPKEHIVVITGGNQGIGYHTAKWIAMMGATVIIACRSQERALKAIEQMNEEYQDQKKEGKDQLAGYDRLNVEFMILDCASLKSVQTFIKDFKSSGRKLHTLICNAGIGLVEEAYTEDENERVFQVNYLAHFLIVSHLLPVMLTSGENCRVLLVSSSAHAVASFDDKRIQEKSGSGHTYNSTEVYAKSKIYQIMHMYSLNRLLAKTNVTVNSIHPGMVETPLLDTFAGSNAGCFLRCCVPLVKVVKGATKTPFEGAWTSINAAVNPEYNGRRDIYFVNSKPNTPASLARNKQKQEILWEYTLECLKDYLTKDQMNFSQEQIS